MFDGFFYIYLVLLLAISVNQIITGKSSLAGNRMIKGTGARALGTFSLSILIISMFTSLFTQKILILIVILLNVTIYLFLKGDGYPLSDFAQIAFKSRQDEIKTYFDIFKGFIAFSIVLALCFGIVYLIINILT